MWIERTWRIGDAAISNIVGLCPLAGSTPAVRIEGRDIEREIGGKRQRLVPAPHALLFGLVVEMADTARLNRVACKGVRVRLPDLGALEVGQPQPVYGPRWLTSQPFYR